MNQRSRLADNPFGWDCQVLALMIVAAIVLFGRVWLEDHPQHNPGAPLDLRDPPGWATAAKLSGLRDDPANCRAVLERSGIQFIALPIAGNGACRRPDRTVLAGFPLSPSTPPITCPLAAGLQIWLTREVEPAAQRLLGSSIARIEHYGSFSCRRIYGGQSGRWSEHATGNAIDIAAFVLEDGRRIGVLNDWNDGGNKAAFLEATRDGACRIFGTVLSPDYNAAHRDHFHFDQQPRGVGGVCQ